MTKLDSLNSFSELETERLILRRMKKSDADDMFEYARNEELTKYLLWRPHPNRQYTYTYLSSVQKYYRNGSYFDYAVVLKSENKMIGTCGFTHVHAEHNSAEIGYVINPAYQNSGYATEAALALLRFGFCNLGFNRIEARYMDGNLASRRVMDKLGMKYEGMQRALMLVKGRYVDICVCAMLEREFTARYGAEPVKVVTQRTSIWQ